MTLRTSASAIRASSCVNLSNFLSASSRSVLPANFFRNFSTRSSVTIHRQQIGDLLVNPRPSSFVTIPKIRSTSTMISVIMSVMAEVGVISVYVSSRLKKNPMRSNSSARTSLLAAVSLAAYETLDFRKDLPKEIYGILARRKTPIPEKIAFAGENTYRVYIRGCVRVYFAHMPRLTRLTPPETAAENA